jgi:hypothetical protein
MALPGTLNTATPGTTDALDQGDDQIRALKLLIADVFGLPVDPTAITGAVSSVTAAGLATFLQNLEIKAGTAFKGILTHANTVDRTYTFPNYTSRVLQAGYGSIGQTSKNNTVTPDTQFDLDADVIWLRNTTNDVVVRFEPGAVRTNNVQTGGPIINGRDQAGVFSADSWVHMYWIWDGTTLASLSSATAPPTGPTLPTDYTHWCYAGAVRYTALQVIARTRIFGNTAYFDAAVTMASVNPVTASVETAVELSTIVPPNAMAFMGGMQASISATAGGVAAATVSIRSTTGNTLFSVRPHSGTASEAGSDGSYFEFPNVSQRLFYMWVDDGANSDVRALTITIIGYRLPNGG